MSVPTEAMEAKMTSQESARDYEPLLERLGKIVGVFGVFIAASFLYGYFYQLIFFVKFDSGWLISLYSTESIVGVGVPWVLGITIVSVILFVCFPAVESFRRGMRWLLVCVAVGGFSLLYLLQHSGFELGKSPVYEILEFSTYVLCCAGTLPSALRKYLEGYSASDVMGDLIFGLIFSCLLIPSMMAMSRATDVRLMFPGYPLIKSDDRILGVLLGNAADKYIVLTCDDYTSVKLYDHSSDYSVMPRKDFDECMPLEGSRKTDSK